MSCFEQAVKLESARLGRTRYLVVVSCARKPAQRKSLQQQNNLINAQNINININNNKGISLNRSGSIENQNSCSSITPSPNRKATATMQPDQLSNSSAMLSASLKAGSKHLINEKDLTNLSRLSTSPKQDEKLLLLPQQQQPLLQPTDNFDEITQTSEVEEACLLGIDCNEKTSVGLVLRILGDTTIRLDGDG